MFPVSLSAISFFLSIGWLVPVKGDQHKAFCNVCNVELKPHRNDLKKHAESGKHKQKLKVEGYHFSHDPLLLCKLPIKLR